MQATISGLNIYEETLVFIDMLEVYEIIKQNYDHNSDLPASISKSYFCLYDLVRGKKR